MNNATRDKNAFFDQLQLRQAEVESAQAHLELLEHQNTELQFQLRESNDRITLLREECAELAREQENRIRDPVHSADEIARMVSATEVKYEAKLAELKRNLTTVEKERYESEADWSRKLKEKVKDLEDLKRVLGSATKTRENDENFVAELKAQLSEAQDTNQTLQRQNSELPLLRDQIQELEVSSNPNHFCWVFIAHSYRYHPEGTQRRLVLRFLYSRNNSKRLKIVKYKQDKLTRCVLYLY